MPFQVRTLNFIFQRIYVYLSRLQRCCEIKNCNKEVDQIFEIKRTDESTDNLCEDIDQDTFQKD